MKVNSAFVFSWRLDLLAFYVPMALAFALSPIAGYDQLLPYVIIGLLFGDMGHVCASIVPLALDKRTRTETSWWFWLPLVAVVVGGSVAGFFYPSVFRSLVAYFIVFHVMMQVYGWLKVLHRKSTPASVWSNAFDIVVLWSLILVPFAYWHTGLSPQARTYLFPGDMAVSIPREAWPYLKSWFWIAGLAWFAKWSYEYVRYARAEIGKAGLMLHTAIWFYYGLVVSVSPAFFFITLILSHGFGYHIHVNNYWRARGREAMPAWFRRDDWFKYSVYFGGITILALISVTLKERISTDALFAIYWSVLLIHHTYDGLLWRRSTSPFGYKHTHSKPVRKKTPSPASGFGVSV